MRSLWRKWVESSDDLATLVELFRCYFRKFAGAYALIGALVILSSGATAASAWFVKDIVNTLFVEQKGEYLYPIVCAVIMLFSLRGIAMYFQGVLMSRVSSKIIANVQTRMFFHVLRQRVRFFEKRNSDHLLMLLNQGAAAFNSILTRVVLHGARDLVTVIALFGVMLFQDPVLTLLCALTVPPVFFGVNLLLRKIKSLSEQELKSFADLNRLMRETAQGAKTIKAFNMQQRMRLEAREVIETLRLRTNRIAALHEAPVPILDTLGGVAVGMAILYAGLRSAWGHYDVGTFMSFLTALLLAADPGRRLSQLRVNLRKSLIGVRMVHELLDEDDAEPEGVLAPPPARMGVSFRGVRFAYREGRAVIDDFTLDIPPGAVVALVGPSGAGKSTLFSLLLKFSEPCSGAVFVGGHDIRDWNTHALRQRVSYVGQSNFIFSGSIRDNLVVARESGPIDDAELDAACAAVGLAPFVAALPQGYDSPIGELGAVISGGQAQRLNIARAILKDAPVLLLDEATSALDADNEALVKAYVASQRGAKTILIIAHRLSTVRDADAIAVIDGGRLIAYGPHRELIESDGYYRRVVSMQLAS